MSILDDPRFMRHTKALTYSRWERLVFRLTRRWPAKAVERRLVASMLDDAQTRELIRETMAGSWRP